MSKRRMFSPAIVESDAFLDMPLSAQALYFHLGMSADDDGFVSPKRVQRMINANDDDLKILVAKRFILSFQSGVVVVKHWRINNQIRPDRYVKTTYEHELTLLTKNEFGAYTEISKITTIVQELTDTGNQMATNGKPDDIPTVNPVEVSIGKFSIGKSSVGGAGGAVRKASIPKVPTAELDAMLAYWTSTVGYTVDSMGNRKACAALLRDVGSDKLKQLIQGVAKTHNDQYAPRISDFVALKRKKNDLILWGRKALQSTRKGMTYEL